ncbi:hypothetical protein POM88_052817 [Heracleum sosnowskyi]|uniref:Uncharacterized protein n=1 Tax=Heracleum sosnowskyi TaxID=360622 RepID=A0AAD8GRQ1_9APIA|nr:hypothetical protein POM88_052817 [Heracleum sosnowskyi]
MAEEVNVLVFGHPRSGKSSIISRVLELGGQLSKEQIQSYKYKSKDDSQIEVKSDWYLNYVRAAKKPKPKFSRIFYQKDGRKFMLLEFQSDEDYFQKLMKKTKIARIGVLVLSGIYHENFGKLEAIQTRKYIQLFRAICGSAESLFHASSKLIVLINKNDDDNFHFGALRSKMANLLKHNGFDTSKAEIISFSSRSDEDMQLFLSQLSALAASKDCCLRSENCMETPDPVDSIFKNMWDKLIITDVHLDADSCNKNMWRERAETLYVAGKLLEEQKCLEASNTIKVACKAAEKALISNVDDVLLSLILCHGHYENGNYQVAINHYEKGKELASKDKNLEGNIHAYLLFLGEIHMEKAKELVKQSQQVIKY